jgi:peptide/nickel transport system permease protein
MKLPTKTRFDKKLDKIRDREEKKLSGGIQNRSLKKLLNNRLAVFGLVFVVVVVLAAIFAPFLTDYDPTRPDLRNLLEPPSLEHILGTDQVGRDVFSRIIYGGRISIIVGLGSALGAAVIGVILGAYAGYRGGWLDSVILRLSEIMVAFPQIILVMMLVAIAGQSLINLIIIFTLTGWAGLYRITRAQMLSLREEEYVQALKAFGLSDFNIAFKHILPNCLGPIMVNITLNTAMFILAEAGLSFLGLGVPLQIATWGNILSIAIDLRILENYWWVWAPAAVMISMFVLSINFLGDGLRDSTDTSLQG